MSIAPKLVISSIVIGLIMLGSYFLYGYDPVVQENLEQDSATDTARNELKPTISKTPSPTLRLSPSVSQTPTSSPLPSPAPVKTPTTTKPVLKNLGIKIEPWNKITNMAGDILFENKNYTDNKIFTEFGHKIVNEFGEKLLPEIGFNVPVGTKVVSPIDGIITDVKLYEPSQDYIVFMKIDESSPWIVGFEHIYNVRMNVGDKVSAGQEIAEVSPSYGKTEFGNVEINVWTAGQSIIKYCPYDFLEESLKLIYKEKINRLAVDWEEFIGQDVYKQENWVAPGCLVDKIIER